MRLGVRLGVDVGTSRVGIARSDPYALLATPVETIARGPETVARVLQLSAEYDVTEIVVGLPVNLRNNATRSTDDARAFARDLAGACSVPVRLVDERLTTVSAHAAMRATGRSQKTSRGVIDQVAAVVLLQHALDMERGTATPSGTEVTMENDD